MTIRIQLNTRDLLELDERGKWSGASDILVAIATAWEVPSTYRFMADPILAQANGTLAYLGGGTLVEIDRPPPDTLPAGAIP